MAVRAKTKRRLVILMVSTLVLIGGVAGVYAVRMKQIEQQTQQFLADGKSHLEAGNHFEAMHALGSYIRENPTDWEVLYQFAHARLKVKEPGDRQVLASMSALARVIDLNPKHPTARHELLDLYVRSRRLTEARQTADAILATDPDNTEALYAKALTLVRFSQEEEALPILDRFRTAKPDDLEGNLLWLHIVTKLQRNADDVSASVQALLDERPEDPRFELLMSKTYQYARNAEASREMARAAASRSSDDETLLLHLVHQLEMLGLHEDSNALLEKEMGKDHDEPVIRLLAHRLWQQNRHGEVLELLVKIEGGTQYGDTGLLALKALTLTQKGMPDQATPIIEALSNRQDDEVAKIWALVLRDGIAKTKADAGAAIKLFRTATERVPSNPIFRFYLGRAYLAAGEAELGHRELAQAINAVPSWPEPLLVLGKSLLAERKYTDAHALARIGISRWPRSIRIQSFRAQAWAAHANAAGLPTEDLAKLVAEIQKIAPGDPRTLVIHVALLASADRKEEAIAAVEAALNADLPPSPATLLQLIQVSRNQELGLADRCLALYRKQAGDTSDLALSEAIRMAGRGSVEEGLAQLDAGLASADEAAQPGWQLARARYLERLQHEKAAEAWMTLAKSHSANRQIQQMALRANSTWQHRQFIDATIERHRKLNAERSPVWRVARAKWWLTGPTPLEHVDEAEALLLQALDVDPSRPETHLLLATCFEMKGHLDGAAEQVSAALKITPEAGGLHLELARLRQTQNDFVGANEALGQALDAGTLTPEQLRRSAEYLAQQGQLERACHVLVESYGGDTGAPNMLLASIYRRLKQPENAAAVIARMLEHPSPSTLAFVANFHAVSGNHAEAAEALSRLDTMELAPGQRELILAKHAGRHGMPEEAVAGYRAAAAVAPTSPDAHLGLAYFLLRAGAISESVEAIAKGAEAAPKNVGLQFVHQHADLISMVQDRPDLRPIAESLILEPANRIAAADAMNTLKPFAPSAQNTTPLTLALRRLSDAYPRFLGLQNLVVRLYFMAGLTDDAIAVADRTMTAFPNAVEPASLAAAVLAQTGRWSEALSRTREWQRRSIDLNPESAVVMVHALLQTGDPDEAVEQLEPFIEEAMQDPQSSSNIIVPHIQALIGADRADEAATMVQPLLPRSKQWRSAWIWLAVFGGADEATGTRWLEQVAGAIPEDHLYEQVTLAQGWQGMADQYENDAYTQRAHAILSDLANRDNAPIDAHFVLAMLNDASGRKQEAAIGYRKVLEMDGDRSVAKNNLAMLLLQGDSDLSDAVRLAREAVEAEQGNPNFRDTLAFALTKAGQPELAVAELEEAIKVAPNNAVWQINLAWILTESGEIDRARQVMAKVSEINSSIDELPEAIQARFDQLRSKLKVSAMPSAG